MFAQDFYIKDFYSFPFQATITNWNVGDKVGVGIDA